MTRICRRGSGPDRGCGLSGPWLTRRASSRAGSGRSERVFLLPSINLLEHSFPYEITDSVEVVVAVDHPHEVVIVTPLDSTGDGYLREDLLPRLR
jgi:hypothetical protein